MTADEMAVARRRLHKATCAIDQNMPLIAEVHADAAARIMREARLSGHEQRAIVAPHDGPTRGDRAVIACVILVAVWLLTDMIGALL